MWRGSHKNVSPAHYNKGSGLEESAINDAGILSQK